MAKYDKETKFYWLQLKENFFEDDAIQWLEEQENGEKYSLFYLKLCLKSLKTNGIMVRNVGDLLIPYDVKKLAEITHTKDIDTVRVAMELLKTIGLVKILENGEIYLEQLQYLVGSKSIGALKKQQQRLISGQKEDKCPPKIEIEQELEIEYRDRDKDINQNNNKNNIINTTTTTNIYESIESNFGRTLSPMEYETIQSWLSSYNEEIINYAVRISVLNNHRTFNYVNGILKNWKSNGYKTLEEIKDNEETPKRHELTDEQKEIFDYDWLNDPDRADEE